MRFSLLSFLVQMPHLDRKKEAEILKGSPLTNEEDSSLEERAFYTLQWMEKYAPNSAKYDIFRDAPSDMVLSDVQKTAFKKTREVLQSIEWSGEKIHTALHAVKAETGIEPKQFFEPFYQLFLHRSSGPQLGWFLSVFPREDVLRRLDVVLA